MVQELILGIDVGTTSVKAGVIDQNGKLIDYFVQSYPTTRSAAAVVEQNADDWVRLIRNALSTFAHHPITAIGLTSQVNTHVFIGADGRALMPAIVWQDGRASKEAALLDAQVNETQKMAWWGAPMPIDASHACARMAWVAKHHPRMWEQTRYVMLPKDYCLLQLTGIAATDPVSNIGLVDGDLQYIPEVFDLVAGAADKAVPLAGINQVIGHISDGPCKGTPVVCGTMDAWAGLVGTGGAREGAMIYLSGTSEILGISSQTVVPTPGAIVFPACEGLRVHAAPTQSGGDAKLWCAQMLDLSLDAMSEAVAGTPRSQATPLFLPQLQGERAPLWDADLRAAFLGVSRQTSQTDMARAVYEGVAFSARMALETLQASAAVTGDRILCGGGGFQSTAWNQIRADVLGCELHVLAAKEPGILGAATMAAIGTGRYSNFQQAYDALAVYDQLYTPNAAQQDRYNALYDIYREAITTHADIGKRLTAIHATSGKA